MYIYIYIHTHVSIYIYIHRERERDVCLRYIYIYIYTYIRKVVYAEGDEQVWCMLHSGSRNVGNTAAELRGNHLSDATCLTRRLFFKVANAFANDGDP